MRVSIRVRTLLVMNLLVLGVAVVLGRIAGEVAGQVVEDRLASELVRNTSNFLQARKLPFTDSLMRYLSQMFGVEVATFRSRDGSAVASSLPPDQTRELQRQVASKAAPLSVTLGGQAYRVDSHDLVPADQATHPPEQFRLCLVVPQKQFQQARDRAMERTAVLALPAVAVATVLAFLLSVTITRPIRKLAAQMDELSERATGEHPQAERSPLEGGTQIPEGGTRIQSLVSLKRGPSEVVRLGESFDHLLRSLREVQGQLAQSERLATLGSVAASVAHELRNPLSGIKMNVRVLRDQVAGSPHDGSDESFRLILREIDRMDLYLGELLSLAGNPSERGLSPRGSGGVRESVNLAELAESVLSLLEGRFRHAGVEVRRDFRDGLPVRADGEQIRQVIMNLLINALEAMPGGGAVTLGLGPAESGGMRFAVTDGGPGVRPPAGADVFEPFVTTKPGSAGLGLHLCRRIIRDHGGKIGYNNSEAGATFWFELTAEGQ